jgi:uncharacterized protein YdcH (DUF465 family)
MTNDNRLDELNDRLNELDEELIEAFHYIDRAPEHVLDQAQEHYDQLLYERNCLAEEIESLERDMGA